MGHFGAYCHLKHRKKEKGKLMIVSKAILTSKMKKIKVYQCLIHGCERISKWFQEKGLLMKREEENESGDVRYLYGWKWTDGKFVVIETVFKGKKK